MSAGLVGLRNGRVIEPSCCRRPQLPFAFVTNANQRAEDQTQCVHSTLYMTSNSGVSGPTFFLYTRCSIWPILCQEICSQLQQANIGTNFNVVDVLNPKLVSYWLNESMLKKTWTLKFVSCFTLVISKSVLSKAQKQHC